jgi:acetolactate decarboxylase
MSEIECSFQLSTELWHSLRSYMERVNESPDQVVGRAISEYLTARRSGEVHQFAPIMALVEGVTEGGTDIETLKRYGDLGLGTFEYLDGELLALDGRFFQMTSDGVVREVQGKLSSPFATLTRFEPTEELFLRRCETFGALEVAFDGMRRSDNVFSSLRVDGHFNCIRTRALCRSKPGVKLLEASKLQPEFEYRNVKGTLVGFWSPEYAKTLNVPGYHFHFLSEDKTAGGHLLACEGQDLNLKIQTGTQLRMVLPETRHFFSADLRRDPTQDLEKAERDQGGRPKE